MLALALVATSLAAGPLATVTAGRDGHRLSQVDTTGTFVDRLDSWQLGARGQAFVAPQLAVGGGYSFHDHGASNVGHAVEVSAGWEPGHDLTGFYANAGIGTSLWHTNVLTRSFRTAVVWEGWAHALDVSGRAGLRWIAAGGFGLGAEVCLTGRPARSFWVPATDVSFSFVVGWSPAGRG